MKKRHKLTIYITATTPDAVTQTLYTNEFRSKWGALIMTYLKTIGLDWMVKKGMCIVRTEIKPSLGCSSVK